MKNYRVDTNDFIDGIFYMHSEDCRAYPGQFAALSSNQSCCDALREARQLYSKTLKGKIIGCKLCCCSNCNSE